MQLTEYIKEIGAKQFATRFGIPERTAISYQYGARRPRPGLAFLIVAKSPVTWAGIYGKSKAS